MPERVVLALDGGEIGAELHHAADPERGAAVVVHALGDAGASLAGALRGHGVAVLAVDVAALGRAITASDVAVAAASLRSRAHGPLVLVGHGSAAGAIVAALDEVPEVAALALIAAEIDASGAADASARLAARRVPVLVCHGSAHGVDAARRLADAAGASYLALDRVGEVLGARDAAYAGSIVAAWVERYLPEPGDVHLPQEGLVVVRGGRSGLAQDIRAGRHRLRSDEPETVPGGTGTGPTPYGLLLASLGSCTSMTLRLYADRKGWPLEAVEVRLRHSKIHAVDCASCETKAGKLDYIEREITLRGPLDEDMRQRLLDIADKCPVHRTLHSEIKIETRLVE